MHNNTQTEINCNAGILTFLENGIITITPLKGHEITIADAQEFINTIKTVSDNIVPLLVDHREQHNLTPTAIGILSTTDAINALALLVDQGLNELMAETFKFEKPNYPVQLFYEKETALK